MNIVVLAGGISPERDVSFSSGTQVYYALKKKGHQVILIDVYLGYPEDCQNIFSLEKDWAAEIGSISEQNPDLEAVKAMRKDDKKSFFGPNVLDICNQADLVFLALHGENGENGKIQATFDLLGIPYTGTDYVSSAICMDKGLTKEVFALHAVSTPAGICLKKGQEDPRTVPLPCVVKACKGGSSVGVYIANTKEEYEKAKQEAFTFDTEIIIEQYIKGREFSVGVIDGKALPVIEIAPIQGFYDYKNKYQAGSTIETCPADLPEAITKELQSQAELAFSVLRLRSYARMDFMMDENNKVYCLEANTLPGMTPTSLLPQEAAATGMSFEELCETLVQTAFH